MPAWATVTVTLGTTAIAVAGTLLGGWLQDRRAQSRNEAEARSQRVREGADLIARIEVLLSDANPDRIGANVDRDSPMSTLAGLQADWLNNLRPTLASFALADESAGVRTVGRGLEAAIHRTIQFTAIWVRELTDPRGGRDLIFGPERSRQGTHRRQMDGRRSHEPRAR